MRVPLPELTPELVADLTAYYEANGRVLAPMLAEALTTPTEPLAVYGVLVTDEWIAEQDAWVNQQIDWLLGATS